MYLATRVLHGLVARAPQSYKFWPPCILLENPSYTSPTEWKPRTPIEVEELRKWATTAKERERATIAMCALDTLGMSEEAKSEWKAILQAVPVWDSYYLLKKFPLT
jgi:hypothetical protein